MHMWRPAAMGALGLLWTSQAWGGDVHVGIGAALGVDLPDAVGDGASFGAGPGLQIPVRWWLSDVVALRGSVRLDAGWGRDTLTWNEFVNGEDVRFYNDDVQAVVGGLGLTLGVEIQAPFAWPVVPYAFAAGGGMGVGTWHTLSNETIALAETLPTGEVVSSNPYTLQAVWLTEVGLGAHIPLPSQLDLWAETGYSNAYTVGKNLQKSSIEQDGRRQDFSWNTFRVALGVSFVL